MSEALLSGEEGARKAPVLLQLQRSISNLGDDSSARSPEGRLRSDVVKVTFNRQATELFLPENEKDDKLSGPAVFCNFFLSIVGTTILGIASQMKRAGWILAPALLVFGCAVVVEMTYLVSITIDKMLKEGFINEIKAYPDYARGAFGPWGLRITALTTCLSCVGMICSGMIVEAQNLNSLIPLDSLTMCENNMYLTPDCGKNIWAVLISSTTVFYSFVPTGTLLKGAAKVGPLCCILCIVFALIGTGRSVMDQEEIPVSCRDRDDPGFPYWYTLPPSIMPLAAVSAYMFYCFACVTTVPTLKNEMAEPRKLVPAATGAYVTSSGIFLVIMLVGYWGFGNAIPDNLISGMRIDRPPGWWATERGWESGTGSLAGQVFAWMITINLLLTDAVFVPCTIVAIEQLNPDFFEGSNGKGCKIALRLFISFLRLAVTIRVTSFVVLTTLTSALFCVIDNILLPIVAFYALRVQSVSIFRRCAHVLIFIFGVMVAALGTYSAISELVGPSSEKVHVGTYPASGTSDACTRAHAATIR